MLSVHASPLAELGVGEHGGMRRVVRRLCEGLAAAGIPSDVFVRRDDPRSPSEELLAPGSRLVRLSAGPPEPMPKRAVLDVLPAFTRALLEHAESERRSYRLVHAHYWLSGFVGRRAAQRWEVPLVQSFHTLARLKTSAGLPADPDRAEVEQILVRSADRLVALSPSEEDALVGLYAADPERVCVVPPGVDLERFSPRPTAGLRRALDLLHRRVVLYAGRLERLKGPDTLIEAMAALAARPGFADVVTLIAGDDSSDGRNESGHPGGERGRLAALAAEQGIGDRVRFLGAVAEAELADLYALADVCVVPSHTETFGLVALEAQASGTPVVAAAVGGLTDIVVDGVTGRLVTGRDPAGWAAAIAGLLGAGALRDQMGAAARDHAARYTWARATDRLRALYDCVEEPAGVHAEEACGCL